MKHWYYIGGILFVGLALFLILLYGLIGPLGIPDRYPLNKME